MFDPSEPFMRLTAWMGSGLGGSRPCLSFSFVGVAGVVEVSGLALRSFAVKGRRCYGCRTSMLSQSHVVMLILWRLVAVRLSLGVCIVGFVRSKSLASSVSFRSSAFTNLCIVSFD